MNVPAMPIFARICFLSLALGFWYLQLLAQAPQQLRFEALTVNDGLSQGYVTSIFQDRKGFMWFGTNDGLNRYDGYEFTIYRHNPSDTTTIADDAIRSIFEDSKGRLWIGTAYRGLEMFDRKSGKFVHFPKSRAKGPSGSSISDISEDRFGNIWLATSGGMDRLHISTIRDGKLSVEFSNLFSAPQSTGGQVNVVHGRTGSFIIAADRILQLSQNPADARPKVVCWLKRGQAEFVPTLMEDTLTGSYLLVTQFSVLKFEGYRFSHQQELYRSDQMIIASTIDSEGYLWIEDKGKFVRLHTATGKKEIVSTEPGLRRLAENTLTHYTDPGGVIWMSTGGFGILKYHPARDYFHHISKGNNTYQILPVDGNWLVINGRNLIRPQVGTYENTGGNTSANWEADFRWSVAAAGPGQLWVNSDQSIKKVSLSGRVSRVFPLKLNEVFPLYSGLNGQLWIGSDSVLTQFDTRDFSYRFHQLPERPKVPGYSFVQQILQETDGNLWLATVSGLLHFNTSQRKWKTYANIPADQTSLSHNFLLSLCADPAEPDRFLWVGTKGGGLNRLDKKTGRFDHFTVKEGLPNNVVYGILADKGGHLWLSTNYGIADFDPKRKLFRNFTSRDGLQNNEFNRYAFAKRNDTLFFGGINGINYFLPDQIHALRPPRVFLTGFSLFNKPLDFMQQDSPLATDISYTKHIELQYDQNMIGLTFAAADYRGSGHTRYRYRLDGLDKQWIIINAGHEATYTNLDPGHYTFQVQASVDGIEWGTQPGLLTIDIIAPFWQRWYFYMLAAVFTCLVLYGIYRYRMQQIMRLQHLRHRISRDLHDEVGSSLSTISIYSKVASAQLESATNPRELLQKISENTEQAMEAMSDIIWSTTVENDHFENIINRMREHAVQLFEAKDYALHFTEDESVKTLKMDMEKRKDFYLIYKETLNNIAKHAHGQHVWIDIARIGSNIRLSIRDDGQGFDAATRKSGNGIGNINNRAKALKGKMILTSAPGRGSSTVLEFPVG